MMEASMTPMKTVFGIIVGLASLCIQKAITG
jgi:hypothetical protein